MNEDHVMEINSMMEILRQRLFISHDNKSQRNITSEYTIRSKRDELTNLIFISKNILPNLLVQDDKNNILPVIPTKSVKQLLRSFLDKSTDAQKEKLELILSRINAGKLHLIWVKIPKSSNPLKKNEVRTITLDYSPKHIDKKDSLFRIKIKKQKYPLYYSLFTPNEFDFKQTRYALLQEHDQISYQYDPPENVEQIKTHNSDVFRLNSDLESDFTIEYSFKPSSDATLSIKFGVGVLCFLFGLVVILRSIDVLPDTFIENQTQIGLFIIGGSLLLPQLTTNNSIRRTQIKYYLISVILGIILVVWQ